MTSFVILTTLRSDTKQNGGVHDAGEEEPN